MEHDSSFTLKHSNSVWRWRINHQCGQRLLNFFTRRVSMNLMHDMLPTDEIFLCGALLLYGFILGGATRLIVAWRKRRVA
jgi:hypothetical protein